MHPSMDKHKSMAYMIIQGTETYVNEIVIVVKNQHPIWRTKCDAVNEDAGL